MWHNNNFKWDVLWALVPENAFCSAFLGREATNVFVDVIDKLNNPDKIVLVAGAASTSTGLAPIKN